MRRLWSAIGLVAVTFLSPGASADPPVIELPPIEVIGSAPLAGTGVDRDKVPATTHVVTGDDVSRAGLTGALDRQVAGVALNDAAGNQFQPTLLYRGFAASPLEGSSQGVAVYLNGARFNLPFGDTVNWDLIPSHAIDHLELQGANPVFGLNALGGSLSVQLRNGFKWRGAELTVTGGSFGRAQADFQYGKQSGGTAAYIAGSILHDGGWRRDQSTDLHQVYGDVGWRGDRTELHFNLMAARNGLNGPGTSPVQLLSVDRAAQFTAPNAIHNDFVRLSLAGNSEVTDTTSLQAVIYYDYFAQKVVNGNTPNFRVCDDSPGFLCDRAGGFLTGRSGFPIADYLTGGPYAELDSQTVNTNGYGSSVQITNRDTLFGRPNQIDAGASFDGGVTMFSANSMVGGLTSDRQYFGPGMLIDQIDGSIAPVRIGINNAYYGLYATDTFDITSRLSLNLSGRLNIARISLRDQIATALTGDHFYLHFNPGIGLTYKITPTITAYASYSIANRAPTPAELSCASVASPCTLTNFFVGDPDLKQVVARTAEVGVRGHISAYEGATLHWNVGLYRTNVNDDIVFLSGPIPGRDFFQNVALTRRQGVEAGLALRSGPLFAWIDFAYTDATFQTALTADSPLNPAADANGQIQITRGNRLPGVPRHRLKLGASYNVNEFWTVGVDAVASSGQFLFGDEANLTSPTGGYVVVNVNSRIRITPNIEIFGLVRNLLNAKYETFGTFSDTASIPIARLAGASNTRSLSPAPPIAGYGGVRVTF